VTVIYFNGIRHWRSVLLIGHLLIGCILGLLVYNRYNLRSAVPVAAIGAILPDLIDKPLGHILLKGTLDSGRIYAHTLLFLGIALVAGLLYWRSRSSPLLLVLAGGILTHLMLDGMWNMPNTLFWPALGDFLPHSYPDYFGNALITEVTSPLEWLAGLSIVMIALEVFGDSTNGLSDRFLSSVTTLRRPLYVLLASGGALTILSTLLATPMDLIDLESRLLTGSSALVGGILLVYRDMVSDPSINLTKAGDQRST
jgi:membrane-bound metal-dependent hydrolase YbcI (DUF457 family)